jgi:hypothetical protein
MSFNGEDMSAALASTSRSTEEPVLYISEQSTLEEILAFVGSINMLGYVLLSFSF